MYFNFTNLKSQKLENYLPKLINVLEACPKLKCVKLVVYGFEEVQHLRSNKVEKLVIQFEKLYKKPIHLLTEEENYDAILECLIVDQFPNLKSLLLYRNRPGTYIDFQDMQTYLVGSTQNKLEKFAFYQCDYCPSQPRTPDNHGHLINHISIKIGTDFVNNFDDENCLTYIHNRAKITNLNIRESCEIMDIPTSCFPLN